MVVNAERDGWQNENVGIGKYRAEHRCSSSVCHQMNLSASVSFMKRDSKHDNVIFCSERRTKKE